MRFDIENYEPQIGDERTVKTFSLIPITLPIGKSSNYQSRWLESSLIRQRYTRVRFYGGDPFERWEDVSWVPDVIDLTQDV